MKGRDLLYAVFALGLFAAYPAHAVEVGLRDDFQDGTTQGWEAGAFSPDPPAIVGEDGNRYLQVTSRGGQGPGSRLSVFNIGNQWAGDYTDAGITAILAEVANFGAADVDLRLLLADPQELGQVPENVAVTTGAVHLPAGSDWTAAVFSIAPENLTVVEGDVETLLAGVTELRLFHNPAPDFPPPPEGPPSIVATVGIDNVTAVPEPATAILLAIGAGELVRRRRGA